MPLAHLAKLLIEKGLIAEAEFMEKLMDARAEASKDPSKC